MTETSLLQDIDARLKAALAKINHTEASPDAMGSHAAGIFLAAWSGVPIMSPDDLPADRYEPEQWRSEANRDIAVKEIDDICEAARALLKCFEQPHRNVHHALLYAARQRDRPGIYTGLQDALDGLIGIAGEARDILASSAPPARPGRKPQTHAAKVADRAVQAYCALAGRAATRNINGSEFVEFLREIFSILKIEASAESAARDAIRRRRKKAKTRSSDR